MIRKPFVSTHNYFGNSPALHYQASEMVLRAEDMPQGVYYVNKGFIRQFLITTYGTEFTVRIIKPYEIFPLAWVFNNSQNRYNFEALTDVELLRSPKEHFISFINSHKVVSSRVTSSILFQLEESFTFYENLVLRNTYQRVIFILLYLARYFGKKVTYGVLIDHWFTHQDIASLIGVSRETVSLDIERLKERGLISYQKHLIVLKNIIKLKRVLK